MNQQQREALRIARDRLKDLHDESEAREHTDIGDAWDVMGAAYDAIDALFTPTKEPEIFKTLVLSTSHVTEATAKRLNAQGLAASPAADAIDGYLCDWSIYGWLYYCHDLDEATPAELLACADFARAQGCDFIRFDCDGPVLDALDSWEW